MSNSIPSPEPKFLLKPHPKCLLFPKKTQEEMTHIKDNMVLRHEQGLPPWEQAILLLDGFILDGWHRYQAWHQLADEGACNGYFAQNSPSTEVVQADDETVALRVASRNLSQRNLTADQRAAIWLQLVKETPSLLAKLEAQEKENQQRMKSGKPSENGSPGCSTNAFLAMGANVSSTIMKMARRIERDAPAAFQDLASGNISARKVLKQLEAKTKPEAKVAPKANPLPAVAEGDKVFIIRNYELGDGDVHLEEKTVRKTVNGQVHFEGDQTKDATAIYSRDEAEKRRRAVIAETIKELQHEVSELRKKLAPSPKKKGSAKKKGAGARKSPPKVKGQTSVAATDPRQN